MSAAAFGGMHAAIFALAASMAPSPYGGPGPSVVSKRKPPKVERNRAKARAAKAARKAQRRKK